MQDTAFGIVNSSNIDHQQAIYIQNIITGTFRDILLIYLVTLSSLTFVKYHIVVVILLAVIVFLTFSYSIYIIQSYASILVKIPGYDRINIIFYYIMNILIFLLACITLFFFIKANSA